PAVAKRVVACRAGAAPRAVVLETGAQIVRMAHVRRRVVRQSRRPQTERLPLRAAVPCDIDRTVVAVHHVPLAGGIDPDRVVVAMAHVVQSVPRLASIDGLQWVDATRVHDLRIVRIDANLTEVHRTLILVRDERPRPTLVIRSPDA